MGRGELRLSRNDGVLILYRWPGNVRQIANEMRRLAALAEPGAVLMPEHLSPDHRRVPPDGARIGAPARGQRDRRPDPISRSVPPSST